MSKKTTLPKGAADLDHSGLRPDRNAHMPERVFAEEWAALNRRVPHVNGGFTALENILNTKGPLAVIDPEVSPVGQRDADVAATMMQWLGTKEGRLFLERCEQRIREEDRLAQDAYHRCYNLGERDPELKRLAMQGI